ncbi:CHRD domain-containing protein [Yinghuangia seranimata]|uniref:CHRD domain-containing protein n=1 Tax=Yinghuangia seranimata TaxID=408067 RepID=UPI00248BB56F|nr:CHRD domain-containing protein [Yinghuangia seranimata]MDI2129840.1 CHRD domain-containing protein [Yinghuangia seranimata]
MRSRRFVLPATVLTAAMMSVLTACGSSGDDAKTAAPAAAQSAAQSPGQPAASPPDPGHGGHDDGYGGGNAAQAAMTTGAEEPAQGEATYFTATLTGANEVPGTDGKAVGDPDGTATAYVRIKGNQVAFAITWDKIGAPTAAHIHQGVAGANGPVVVPFFAAALPDSARAATGSVKIDDAALLDRIKNNAERWYFNLHTAEFPGGAVRGQLVKTDKAFDLNAVLKTGKPENTRTAQASGAQEVAAPGKKVNDPDGKATTAIRPWGSCVDYAFSWTNVAPPTLAHVHQAAAGANGAVAVPLFAAEKGLPQSVTGLAGTVEGVKPDVVAALTQNPAGFYTNLHTGEFPDGAVRGQLG